MREQIRQYLKEDTRVLVLRLRAELDLNQHDMGELLEMHKISYAEIEDGTGLCSCVTFVMLLMQLEDPGEYISHLKHGIQLLYEKELQPI